MEVELTSVCGNYCSLLHELHTRQKKNTMTPKTTVFVYTCTCISTLICIYMHLHYVHIMYLYTAVYTIFIVCVPVPYSVVQSGGGLGLHRPDLGLPQREGAVWKTSR